MTMKTTRWNQVVVVVALLVSLSSAVWADAKAKVIAVVNRADWCSVCKTNGERVGKVLMTAAKTGQLDVVVNDMTNDDTTLASAARLKVADVDKAMVPYTATGVVYLFDAKSKRSLVQITVANTDDEIKRVIALAHQKATP
jgi:hypothetical protein